MERCRRPPFYRTHRNGVNRRPLRFAPCRYLRHEKGTRANARQRCRKKSCRTEKRIEAVQKENSALSLKDLAVSGDDLADAGIPRGKEMGRVLKELFDTVLDDPKENTKEKLLTIAQNIYRKTGTETK